jgi:deoxyadenosine/deoxycytidine kinase
MEDFLTDQLALRLKENPSFPFSSTGKETKARNRLIKKLHNTTMVVEGLVGAGKSLFCRQLCGAFVDRDYPCIVLEEFLDDVLLAWFLADKVRHAYEFQKIMLTKRLETYRRALRLKKNGYTVIVDRSLHGDMAFELMHFRAGSISRDQHVAYLKMVGEGSRDLPVPDCCIVLNVSIETSREHVIVRNRPGEVEAYTAVYLTELRDAYQFCLKSFDAPLLQVQYDSDPRRDFKLPQYSRKEREEHDFKHGCKKHGCNTSIEPIYHSTQCVPIGDRFDEKFLYVICNDLLTLN